ARGALRLAGGAVEGAGRGSPRLVETLSRGLLAQRIARVHRDDWSVPRTAPVVRRLLHAGRPHGAHDQHSALLLQGERFPGCTGGSTPEATATGSGRPD